MTLQTWLLSSEKEWRKVFSLGIYYTHMVRCLPSSLLICHADYNLTVDRRYHRDLSRHIPNHRPTLRSSEQQFGTNPSSDTRLYAKHNQFVPGENSLGVTVTTAE